MFHCVIFECLEINLFSIISLQDLSELFISSFKKYLFTEELSFCLLFINCIARDAPLANVYPTLLTLLARYFIACTKSVHPLFFSDQTHCGIAATRLANNAG